MPNPIPANKLRKALTSAEICAAAAETRAQSRLLREDSARLHADAKILRQRIKTCANDKPITD